MSSVEFTTDGVEDIVKTLQELGGKGGMVRAGIIEGSENYTDVLEYAPIQEFGGEITVTPKMRAFLAYKYDVHLSPKKETIVIPSRPFMRTTFEEHKEEWANIMAQYLDKGVDTNIILERVGARMEDDIVATIMSNMEPKLSPMTKKIKEQYCPENADRTLYATGQLAKSIHYEVMKNAESA